MVRSAKWDAQNIFEIIRLRWILRISFNDIVSIIIRVAYRTEVFGREDNIKIAYQLAYK